MTKLPDVKSWSLRLRIFLFFALIALLGSLAIAAAAMFGFSRLEQSGPGSAFILTAFAGALSLVGLVTWVWLLFDQNVARPIQELSGEMRARAHAGVEKEIDHAPARYLGDLAPAAVAVTRDLRETRGALEDAVAQETERLKLEKARLECVLRDAPAGVLFCSADHKVALYNAQAVSLLEQAGDLGLNRPLFELLRRGPVEDAYARLQQSSPRPLSIGATTELLCVSRDDARLFEATMRLAPELTPKDAGSVKGPGYVLTIRDVTEAVAKHTDRDALLREVFERVRRRAANLQTALAALRDQATLTPELEERLRDAVDAETTEMTEAIAELSLRFDALSATSWPMSNIAASDLAEAVRLKLAAQGVELSVDTAPLELNCDGFDLALLLTSVAQRVASAELGDTLSLRIQPEEADEANPGAEMGAVIDLCWRGETAPMGAVEDWLSEDLVGDHGVTGREILDRHGSEIWPERMSEAATQTTALLRMPLRRARALQTEATRSNRLEFYDFDLLNASQETALDDRALDELTFVVFDTETTGLEPERGDEIVQIAATRVVNSRMLPGESFDELVNPERSIPQTSIEIHGVTEEMVADAPTISEIGGKFHRYCGECVIVAHNAPFDMAFLRRHEKRIGARFDQPILDTVLISAVLYGGDAEHSLDAIAERLAVDIPEELRHTAAGDAAATAKVLLKMKPMLREKGITTLGELRKACSKHLGMMTRPLEVADA